MSVADNIQNIQASLPPGVTLIAVSKFHPASTILQVYNNGHKVFGESRAQELKAKQGQLPRDIEWHFIGTLQTNKVKDVVPVATLIHSVDSFKLLKEINKQAAKCDCIQRVLLEIHLAQEETKHGLTPEECRELLQTPELSTLTSIRICGLMCMATDTEDTGLIRQEFHALHRLFDELKTNYFPDSPYFTERSMGMSHDYPIAVEEGSTMIRIGTMIFGEREY